MKITYCMVVLNRLDEMKTALRRVSPHVDRTCIVDGGSTDGTHEWLSSQECKDMNVEFRVSKQYRYAIGNHTPHERNQYLEMAGHEGWLLYTDSDEFLEEVACPQLRILAEQAESIGADGIAFGSHDIWTYENGEVYDNLSNYWNPMFWKGYPGQHYVGHTHSSIARPGAKNYWVRAPFRYEHVKTERRMVHNSTYLYWTTAEVAQNTTDDPTWVSFHKLMQKYGHFDWHVLNMCMEQGKLQKEITDWFIDHRNAENPEERSWFEWYFLFLHPEENVDKIDGKDKPWDYVEQCRIKREAKANQ